MKKWLSFIFSGMLLTFSAGAEIIYQDNFDGQGTVLLNGLAPDIAPQGVTWFAGDDIAANGYATYDGTKFGDTAYLPLTLESGYFYVLTVDIDAINTGNKWAGVGFTVNANTNAADRFLEDGVYYWALTRGATELDQSFGGVRTNNGVSSTTTGADNIVISIDNSSEEAREITWSFNNVSTRSYTAVAPFPDIKYVAFTSSEANFDIDLFQLERFAARPADPVPADGAIDIAESVTLSWADIDAPNIDPNVAGYKVRYLVYDAASVPAEPNFLLATEVNTIANSYGPLTLGKDKVVYWAVDTVLDYNDIVYEGKVWNFATMTTAPTVITAPVDQISYTSDTTVIDPVTGLARYKGDAVFSSVFNCYSPVQSVVWTDSQDNVLSTTYSVDNTTYSSALTISDITPSDQDVYTCTITTTAGKSVSVSADLLVCGQVCDFVFDADATDSISGITGVITSGAESYSDGSLLLGGTQAIDISSEGYPRTGLGNGLQHGTVSIWVRIDSLASGQANSMLMGTVNGQYYEDSSYDLTDAFQIWVTESTLNARLRDTNGASVQASTTIASIIGDGNFHMVTVSYSQGKDMQLYLDGNAVGAAVAFPASLTFKDAAWDYPMLIGANNDRNNGANGYLVGAIADLKIFNYGLDKFEVVDQYVSVVPDAHFCLLEIDDTYDFVKDCKIDILDFAVFASKWLSCGYYPLEACD